MASFTTTATTTNDSTCTIIARPEDVLLACVAYNRPEMRTLDVLIRRRSQGLLATSTSSALPTELLLRIRSHLQTTLRAQLALEAKAALVQYESAHVEGLCTDCFWWNNDIYGSDVWAWVEAGYRGACACVVGAAAVSDSEAHDPRISSPSKQQVERMYNGLTIGNRAQWLRAYVSRAHCGGERAWTAANRVLREFGCVNEVQGHRRQRSREVEDQPQQQQQQIQSREAGAALTALELKKAALGFVPGGFGSPVAIRPSDERAAIEDASVTLARLQRELDIPTSTEEPSIIAEPSTLFFPPPSLSHFGESVFLTDRILNSLHFP